MPHWLIWVILVISVINGAYLSIVGDGKFHSTDDLIKKKRRRGKVC